MLVVSYSTSTSPIKLPIWPGCGLLVCDDGGRPVVRNSSNFPQH